MPVKDKVQLV